MAFAVREYASTIMSVLALVISAMSFYLTNFAKPEDLRVTIYAPNIRTDGSDLEFTAENELNILLGEPIKENIVPIENENAKSYKMTITQDFVFINSGREPILVSAVYVLFLSNNREECTEVTGYTGAKWDKDPFVIQPGVITMQKTSFVHRFDRNEMDKDREFVTCLAFVVVDKTAEEKTIRVSGSEMSRRGGWSTFLTSKSDARYRDRQTNIILKSFI